MKDEDSNILNSRAIECASTGEYPEAIACFKRALTLDSCNYLLWYNLGVTYQDTGELAEAKGALRKAYEFSCGEELEVTEALAMVCFTCGDDDEAFQYYGECLTLDDHNPSVWNNLGVLHFNRNEYGEACDAFENAVYLNPYYYDALFNLRDTYRETGNLIGADECARKLAEIHR
jgi:tetratricopeptide (TPR) repeat protein